MERDLIDPIAVTAIQHVLDASKAVSYTHLDVYKRQRLACVTLRRCTGRTGYLFP